MSDAVERLRAPTTPAAEALALLARLRATPDEAKALDALLERDARQPLPEELLVAVAVALVDRGDPDGAERCLARATSSDALVLRADRLAARGETASAMALVERVMLRDLDWPGARERHARWRALLGGGASGADARARTTTTVMTSAPRAPFHLIRELGRGGAGVVYEAEDRDLGRRVALKVYHRPDRDAAQLLHEVRVAASLQGNGVVRVFDVDPTQGWMAMELATEGALRDRLDAPVRAWALPVAAALARVHAAGWVHHDVKPANVLFASRARVLLTDFGTARRRGEPSPPGSLGFVSPERLTGRPSEPRDDVYGFGRILEEALRIQGTAGSAEGAAWCSLATSCTGPDAQRPDDGAELVARIARR